MKVRCDLLGSHEVTLLLDRIRGGDRQAEAELLPLVYRELRSLAAFQLGRERRGHTLQPTALVHEAYIRIFRQERAVQASGSEHFFALAATVMRRVLVDHARARSSAKRGGGRQRIDIEQSDLASPQNLVDVIALDDALTRLDKIAPRSSRLVELHFFGGLTVEDAAGLLGVSARTAKRDWSLARTWLHKELYGDTATMGTNQ